MSCYNRCGECIHEGRKAIMGVYRPCCVSNNREASFYKTLILFDFDTSKCKGFSRRLDLSQILEINPMYELQEVQGLLVREIKMTPQCESFPQIQLTPFGAEHLALQLIRWAKTQDSEINEKYANINATEFYFSVHSEAHAIANDKGYLKATHMDEQITKIECVKCGLCWTPNTDTIAWDWDD